MNLLAGFPDAERSLADSHNKMTYRPALCVLALVMADVAAAVGVGTWAFACQGAAPASPHGWDTLPITGLVLAAIMAALAVAGRYSRRMPLWHEVRLVATIGFYAALAQAVLSLLLDRRPSAVAAVCVLLAFPALATVGHRLAKRALARAGIWALPVLVVAEDPRPAEHAAALRGDRLLGYRVVGGLSHWDVIADPTRAPLGVLLDRHGARGLLIAPTARDDTRRQLVAVARREGVSIATVPPPYVAGFEKALPGRDWRVSPRLKMALDTLVAASLLAFTSPLFVVLAIACRLDGGPALFAHPRVGVGGRSFNCLKFRTMVVDSDRVLEAVLARDQTLAKEWAATRKLRHDPRVTRVGRLLRKTSLDELPQLINVLRLEMSMVGPRPIVASEIDLYGDKIAQYYAARPGLTGLWQVSGRSNTSYKRRVQLDVWYVNNWTIWHDIAVLLKTIPVVFRNEGAH